MPEEKKQTIAEEAGLPDNWVPVDMDPIVPGANNGPAGVAYGRGGAPAQGPQGFKSTSDMPPYFSGSISPDMAHDSDYVRSQIASPAVPTVPLMPIAQSGKPQVNAAITSIIKSTTTAATKTASTFLFRGVWQSFVTYNVNDVVIFNGSTYLALLGNSGLQPDLNHDAGIAEGVQVGNAAWTLISENLVFNTTPPNVLTVGGFGPYVNGAGSTGSGTSASVTGTPGAGAGIALLTVVTADGGNSITAPTGWTQLAGIAGNWQVFYKVLSGLSPVSPTATLSISDNWDARVDFFQFGGFASVSISQVAVNSVNQATILIGNGSGLVVAGQNVVFSGLSTATFLNGQTVNVTTANATQFTCTIAPGHANYGPTADTGIVSVVMQQSSREASGGGGSPLSKTFTVANVKKGSIFAMFAETTRSGTGTASSTSDTNGNAYTTLNTNQNNLSMMCGFSATNSTAGNKPTVSMVVSPSPLTAAGWIVLELAGSASVSQYQPYDVAEFRGSMWVCLFETTGDAFTNPASWGLIGPGMGYVNSQTASYAALAADTGRLLSFNSSSAMTLTLPNPVPAPPAGISETGWFIFVENIGTGTLTISHNSLTIDGVAADITLGQNQGVGIFADPTGNYETWHGVNSIAMPGIFTVTGPNGSGLITIGLATETANTVWAGPTSGGAATPTFRLLVNADLPATTPTVPPEFSLTGNVASPAGALAIAKVSQPANQVWASPDGAPGVPVFRALTGNDVPVPSKLSLAQAIGTFVTTSKSGVLRLPGNVIPPAGVYRVSVNFFLQANASAGTLDVAIGWNDGTATRSATNGTLGAPADISTAALNVADGTIVIVSDGIHDITWAMTLV